jgi:hypothetical protein
LAFLTFKYGIDKLSQSLPEILKITDKLSPDSSGNPFVFFFKKQKIATDSRNSFLKQK